MPRYLPQSSYIPGDASSNPYLRNQKKLSIEDLQFTQMGRAKLQKHRQSIAYPKFCLDLIEERIDEVYVNVIGQIARYYAIYPDGRLAVCQVPTLDSRELRDLFRMLEINPNAFERGEHVLFVIGSDQACGLEVVTTTST